VVRTIKPPLIRRLPVSGGTLAYIRNALAEVTTGAGTAAGAFSGFPPEPGLRGGTRRVRLKCSTAR